MKIDELLGKTLVEIIGKKGDEEVIFRTDNGEEYKMYHEQECCEKVTVENIDGDLNDLIGSPILQAEESTNSETNPEGIKPENQDYFTWTFYRLGTLKGRVVLRWYGESNGYYSEEVSFEKIKGGSDE
jgi:hypothetical protein